MVAIELLLDKKIQDYIVASEQGDFKPRESIGLEEIDKTFHDDDFIGQIATGVNERHPHPGNLLAITYFLVGFSLAERYNLPFFENRGASPTISNDQYIEISWQAKEGGPGLEDDSLRVLIHLTGETYELKLPDLVTLVYIQHPEILIRDVSIQPYNQLPFAI